MFRRAFISFAVTYTAWSDSPRRTRPMVESILGRRWVVGRARGHCCLVRVNQASYLISDR